MDQKLNMTQDAQKMKQIEAQLLRLQRQHWLPTLTLLIGNFNDAIGDEEHNVTNGILEVLKSLITDDENNDTLGIKRFQKMLCFNYRFYKGVPATYWDPTTGSLADFAQGEKMTVYEWNTSHPAPDILMRWMAERFDHASKRH